MTNKISQVSVYVGCGEDRREGFHHCDKRPLEGVDVACDAWELSQHFTELKEIYSRHMLEHLTSMEADTALNDWFKALDIGGKVYIVVPNLDFHIQQWLNCEWTEETLRDPKSDARHGFAGLYGWQRECNPKASDYNNSYWDVHKSGYNEKRMRFLLERAGFTDVEISIKNDIHLVAQGTKTMSKSERQVTPSLQNIRPDHMARYKFAVESLSQFEGKVLDCACGIGYGSYVLASNNANIDVTGVDIDQAAINYARQHYAHANADYLCQDARKLALDDSFAAVVSFETIEHVPFAEELLTHYHRVLKPGGTLICSTPNQDVIPFDPEKYVHHIRHYTYAEIAERLEAAGFVITSVHTQLDEKSDQIEAGDHGKFLIMTCRKK